jgi:septal ring factor EnvC (AmiA/AmiB activator)
MHPVHYELATMDEDDLRDVLKQMAADPDTVSKLQPVLDAKHQINTLNKQLKADKKKMDEVAAEERRIRDNMASIKGTAGEQALSKRYAEEMNQQEDKLAALQKDRDSLTEQHDAVRKQMEETANTLQMDTKLPQPVQKAALQ